MANTSISAYAARRSRWLRVRKFTVPLATFVEPGVEPLLCSTYGAYALITIPLFSTHLSIPSTWMSFFATWCTIVACWQLADYFCYRKLHSCASVERDADTPWFARPPRKSSRRPLGEWMVAWWGRELLALPIWSWAIYGGTTVVWRGKKFRVGLDMKVKEIRDKEIRDDTRNSNRDEIENGRCSRGSNKSRVD